MKPKPASALTPKGVLLYVLAYLLWLVSIVVCVVAVIQLRATANALWAALGGDRYSVGVVNQVSLLLGGLAALIYVMYLESYYRGSVTRRVQRPEASSAAPTQGPVLRRSRISQWLTRVGLAVLLRRFAITIAIPLGVIVISLALLEVALRAIHR
ncbi:MAG: hypothetical protein NT169_26080 [Chloroflexi bacterium]|nr:hypothetical protein [Chloroflexota bacterium]